MSTTPSPFALASTWKDRYDRMKAHYHWTDADVADALNMTLGAVQLMVNRQGPEFSRMIRGMLMVFEAEHGPHPNATTPL